MNLLRLVGCRGMKREAEGPADNFNCIVVLRLDG